MEIKKYQRTYTSNKFIILGSIVAGFIIGKVYHEHKTKEGNSLLRLHVNEQKAKILNKRQRKRQRKIICLSNIV